MLSALEMSHYDVTLASEFLLDRDKARSKGNRNGRSKSRTEITSRASEYSPFVCNANFTTQDNDGSPNNNNQDIENSLNFNPCPNSSSAAGDVNIEHIRPTRV